MDAPQQYLDQLLFAVLPYMALITFFGVTIQRYSAQKYTYSSLSSQFLENQQHFWALVPFHFGILVVLVGHVVAFLLPRHILAWNSQPLRLYVLEISALIFGLLTLIGVLSVIIRRVVNVKARTITSPSDWVLYLLLAVQAVSGVYIAVMHPWGSSWFASSATPYLWSILKLNPDITYVMALPWMVKVHIVNACLVIGFFPFTRLVHILVIPNPYLWRKPQVVRWNRAPGEPRGGK
jgi:nitrate reductase gamma subunit